MPYTAPELSGIFETISDIIAKGSDIAQKAEQVVGAAKQVKSGKKKVALVDPNQSTFVIPVPGKPIGIGVPSWALFGGLGLVAYLLLRRRR